MLLLMISYIGLIIMGIRIIQNKNFTYYFNQEITICLKAMCALIILLGHLQEMMNYLNSSYSTPIYMNAFSGCLAVGVFFFLSGYGLSVSNSAKKNFFKRRILKVLIPYLICNIAFFIVLNVAGEKLSVYELVLSWINGHPIVTYSWYIISQFVFYIMFYLAYKINSKRFSTILFFETIGYTAFLVYFGKSNVWYHECFCFWFGCFCAEQKEYWYNLSKKNFFPLVSSLLVVSILLYELYNLYLRNDFVYLDFSGVFLCLFIFIMNMKINVVNKPLLFIGKISLEIYLYQGLVMRVLKQLFIRFNVFNVDMYAISSVLLTIMLASIIHYLTNKVINSKLLIQK